MISSIIPWKPLAPLVIRGASLSADGGKVRLASSDLSWDNVPFSLTGTTEFGGETVVADLDLSAGDIDVDTRDSVVRLSGTVGSDTERQLAEFIAKNTSGVLSVSNELETDRSG